MKPMPKNSEQAPRNDIPLSELKALIDRVCSGDRQAVNELVLKTQKRLYRFCMYLCGNEGLAEDLTQETYLKVLDKIKDLKNPEAFYSWFYRTAKNLYLDHVRKAETRLAEATDFDGPTAPVLALETDPRMEEAMNVMRALNRLPAEDRVLLVLVDLEQNSYKEAGDFLGLSEDTVRGRLVRPRQSFRALFTSALPK
jgi:RNA polymerase sigma-70 factor (ECF subfamily)